MIALWMLYAALVAGLAALAAVAVERLLRLWHRPARLAWALALLATVAAPPALLVLPRLAPPAAATVTAGPVIPLGVDAGATAEPGALDRLRLLAAGMLDPAAGRLAPLDRPLLVLWALLSTLAAGALALSALRLRSRRRGWRAETVDGVPVLVAPDAGPAVMGSGARRIVLPSWALALDAPLRALVLRHETEHLRAGDPRLLLAGVLAVVLMPWSPAVWWQVRRLRLAVELDCDRRVLGAGGDVERYGLLLLAVSQRGGGMLRLAMPALSEGATDLERRIAAMTAPPPRRRVARALSLAAGAGAVVAAACVVPSPNTVSGPEAPGEPQARVEAPPAPLVDAGQTFFEFQVEEPVVPANDVAPTYPTSLQVQGISGQVIAQFVVDTLGRADVATFKAIESSHELFTAAVRNALPRMQFTPARVGGRKVKQLVQQAFAFAVDRTEPGSPTQVDPPPPASRAVVSPRAVSTSTPPAAARPAGAARPEPVPAQPLNAVTPVYPAALRSQGVSGAVTVMVVVDSTGQLDMPSFKVVRSDHPLFTDAVRAALPALRYRPATVGDRAVRQVVQLEFTFRVD